jgi:hypothetical protein
MLAPGPEQSDWLYEKCHLERWLRRQAKDGTGLLSSYDCTLDYRATLCNSLRIILIRGLCYNGSK